jgi:Tfp pilus assembly protein PilV
MEMKTTRHTQSQVRRSQLAFTMIELLVSVCIVLTIFVTIFGCMTMGFTITQMSRENLRATQIMLDKMEGVRLYKWDDLNNPAFLQSGFSNWFFETNNIGFANASGNGVQYTGQVLVATTPLTTSYSNTIRQVTVTVNWNSRNIDHRRSMTTYVSQMGQQNYIYGN